MARKEKILAALLLIAAILVVSILRSSSMLSQVSVGTDTRTHGQAALMEKNETSTHFLDVNENGAKTSPQSSFLLPKNEFRPITQLPNKNDACTPAPHQPLYKVSGLFENYANITRFFNTSFSGDLNEPLVCEFNSDQAFSKHFAHSMQQLYGCYSFFQQHYREEQRDRPRILLLSPKTKSQFSSNSFLKGYLEVLQDEMNVEILSRTAFRERYPLVGGGINDVVSVATISVPGGYIISHVQELNQFAQQYISTMKDSTKTPSPVERPLCGIIGHDGSKNNLLPRIGMLNRRPLVGRSIQNAAKIVNLLTNSSFHQQVDLEYFEGSSFVEQVQFFQRTDILISPHGAQLTGLPFLANNNNKCSQLLEIFPPNYLMPSFYGSLARNSNIGYSYLYLSDQPADSSSLEISPATTNLGQRVQARSANLCVALDVIQESIGSLVGDWRECCRRHAANE